MTKLRKHKVHICSVSPMPEMNVSLYHDRCELLRDLGERGKTIRLLSEERAKAQTFCMTMDWGYDLVRAHGVCRVYME